MRLSFILFILLFCKGCFFANAQSEQSPPVHPSELGLPYIQNYSPQEYGAFDQNWDAVQDSLGIMYFANGDGVLTYDGVNWRLLELPGKTSAFSIAITDENIIYVGAASELGYLEVNTKGQLIYTSLLSKLPQNNQEFDGIRTIFPTKDGVFFSSKKYIFKWDGTQFKVWENSGDPYLFFVRNKLFKRMKGKGLMRYEDSQFEMVAKGELYKDNRIRAMLSINKSDFLIATRDKLFIYNGKDFTEFETDATDFFNDNTIYTGIALNEETFALGSLKKGIIILDRKGHIKNRFSKKGLLQSNTVLGIFQDQSGILWASLNSGIAKIEYSSPFSFFSKYNNTPYFINDFLRYHGKLFIGASDGLYYLENEKSIANNFFVPVLGDFGMVFDITLFQDKLLAASGSGTYEIDSMGKSKKIFDLPAAFLLKSRINENRVFIGLGDGLACMHFENNIWTLEHTFDELNLQVGKISEQANGNLWLDINKNEVIRVSFDNANDAESLRKPILRTFTSNDGLPGILGRVYIIEDQVYFQTHDGLFVFDSAKERFYKAEKVHKKLKVENKKVKINLVDDHKNIWLVEYEGDKRIEQLVAFIQKDGTYKVEKLNEGRTINIKNNRPYPEFKDSVIWDKIKSGIVRHDLKQKLPENSSKSRVLISSVLWKNDSLLFGGYKSSIIPALVFKNNQLRFQFASPSFYDESKNQFQYKLEGFDPEWSSWTAETKKDYTNIPEGNYTFMVRAKNIFNKISEEDSYAFTILPPWYRTWWMYLIYAFGTIGVVALISQWRSKELLRKNENLEEAIEERTVEIRHKNELLNHQTEKLVELNAAKTQLYTNITHEFRTPLTVILGMVDALKSDAEKEKFQKAAQPLEMIKRNGKKLLHLVNEMLDIAKLESGNMELNMVQADVIPFVKYLSESFHSLAEDKGINLTVYSEIDILEMDFDANKLAAIITNLISNAVKFTAKNGKIIVHLNKISTRDSEFLVVKVRDNGLGISEEELVHVFDRFYQADTATAKQGQGTGIGLAIAKELVVLMKGTINVESSLGKGSVFTMEIPITHNATMKGNANISVAQPTEVLGSFGKTEELVENVNAELPLVLIIEDNEDVAHYLKTCLQGKYQTIHAINGKVGIDMAYEKIPDIIITDVMMPEKDGYEVCEILKSDERTDHIPIIILTAKVTDKDRLTGLSRGADAYLAKPFQKAELFTRLDQLILLRKKMISKIERGDFTKLLENKVENPETKFIQKVVKFIHEELSNEDLGAIHLARKLYLSESQIYRKLKAITGKSTALFIRSVRLQKAKALILTTDKTISEIAYEVGFNDPSWFSRTFKEEFGSSPNAMRN